jgi:RNA polymerase sigma-70 factor (ECF subfamily)
VLRRDDDGDVSDGPGPEAVLAVYDEALPAVYGYVVRRCGDRAVAEDVTSETFLAAMDTMRRPDPPTPTVPWLIGVARHKLADHWRRQARTPEPVGETPDAGHDDWDVELDRLVAEYTLAQCTPLHRAVLTLRYVDDCTVGQCADALGRSVAATESLLTRAKHEFRTRYPHESQPTRGGRR